MLLNVTECSACGACKNICPKNAIELKENEFGFLYPVINQELCIDCGACQKVCGYKAENKPKPDCYAVMCSDKVRAKSASGGVFKCLADWFLQNGGFVCGAVYDSDWSVKHIVSNNVEDIEKMRGSKYLQSNTKYCFKEIKTLLNDGKKVLFSGTPCQVAGVKSFLNKEYDNLFCLDLLCHGVPSVKIFKKYLAENYNTVDIKEFSFRNKHIDGWVCGKNSVTLNNVPVSNNDYFELFLKNVILRESCYSCKYAKLPRVGDLTIGDFWGIKKFEPKLNDDLGTSVVLENNKKGNVLLNILKENSKIVKKMRLKKAMECNGNIYKPSEPHQNRELFFYNYEKLTLNENKKLVLDDKADCMIINLWYSVNYGAALTCYGVKCLFEKLGLKAKVINFVPDDFKEKYNNSFSQRFAKKYLDLTKPCNTVQDLMSLNKKCNLFVAGSDQIWGSFINNKEHKPFLKSVYMLDFVNSRNKKITYAASFGNASLEKHSNSHVKLMRYFLPQFDFLSVREDEGVEILQNEFGLNSVQLIDGAFHIPKEKLEEMTSGYENKNGDYIACFRLHFAKEKYLEKYDEIVENVSKQLNLSVKEFETKRIQDVEEWLSFIKNSKFVISDSFHAIVFSIIFNVPFMWFNTTPTTASRMESLFRHLGITNNCITRFDVDFDVQKIISDFDWASINKKIEEEVLRAESVTKQAVEMPKKPVNSEYDGLNSLLAGMELENEALKEDVALLADKSKIFRRYYKYKLLSAITFGKVQKRNKEKKYKMKEMVSRIRNLKKI